MIQFGYHIVYSEGTKTEPLYVESIKKAIANKYKCNPNDIEIIHASKKSYNTIGLVKYSLKDIANRLDNGVSIDRVWIMFDKDSFPDGDFNATNALINSKIIQVNSIQMGSSMIKIPALVGILAGLMKRLGYGFANISVIIIFLIQEKIIFHICVI